MAEDPDTLGDARSRYENQRFRAMMERNKASNPEYAYAPRWVPTGNWKPDLGDVILWVIGYGILAMVLVMRLLGYF
ncbi:hypothetical protein AAFN86_14310 [Roseomonas sp. CAU 1739]|uniref:hypothetical protein n=1 Tax=Roseomonas sp. CAU 1739 TaxID=3140364 RepID=UPI00325BACDD